MKNVDETVCFEQFASDEAAFLLKMRRPSIRSDTAAISGSHLPHSTYFRRHSEEFGNSTDKGGNFNDKGDLDWQ